MEKLESLLDIVGQSMSGAMGTGIGMTSTQVAVLVIPDHMPFVTALIASAKENQEDMGDAPELPFRLKRSVC